MTSSGGIAREGETATSKHHAKGQTDIVMTVSGGMVARPKLPLPPR